MTYLWNIIMRASFNSEHFKKLLTETDYRLDSPTFVHFLCIHLQVTRGIMLNCLYWFLQNTTDWTPFKYLFIRHHSSLLHIVAIVCIKIFNYDCRYSDNNCLMCKYLKQIYIINKLLPKHQNIITKFFLNCTIVQIYN